ncbi:hypothetical protein MTYP_00493 [Methylophilaceae bacterium]|nr:hypothetical protein MTYP_00493 [Methylophilaceae bacterium]
MSVQIISAASQMRAAQLFNMLSIAAITLMPAFPILLLWIAGSILVYSASVCHPNPVVREYVKVGGYRFYGLVGSLLVVLVYANELKKMFGGAVQMWLAIWLVSFLIVVPLGLRDIWRAAREEWRDMRVE